jgi:isopenicillin-N epimerase
MVGALAAVPLPDGPRPPPPARDPLQVALFERFAIEVPVIAWPASPRRLVRVSCQIYNTRGQYERLAAALGQLLAS